MKKLENNKKKILILSFIISFILIGVISIIIIFINNKTKPKEELKIELKDNLSFEINSEVNLFSLVSDNNKVEIISKDENIDTSSLGKKEVIIKYKYDDKEKEYKFNINIIDKTKPIIEYKKELSTNVGTKIDLLKDVKVSDNSREEIKATIEGEYDFDKVGTYGLKYIAVDSSNNKVEEEFTLNVNEIPQAPTNNNASEPQTNYSDNTNNYTQDQQSQHTENNDGTYYEKLPFGTIVSDYEDSHNKAIMTKSANFYYYVSFVEYDSNNDIISVEWTLSADKSGAHAIALDSAKSHIQAPPSQEESIILYKENPNIHWGNKNLKYVAGHINY